MKVYTMTFHWATNYGAVLQSYALQRYLLLQGYETEIINYAPMKHKKTLWKCLLSHPKKYKSNFQEWKHEKVIKAFREQRLCLTRLYKTHSELLTEKWGEDAYVCGSDQIWNPHFTLQGEGGVTLSYYLDFVPAMAKKISYAASFGVTSFDSKMAAVVVDYVKDFDKISVRESSAVEMLREIGLSSSLVCDPVFLISKEDWKSLCVSSKRGGNRVFKYILHQPCEENERIVKYISESFDDVRQEKSILSVEEWLGAICDSEMVVTNSFHAVAFSIIFHRPFVAIVQPRNEMNDRFTTLLSAISLQDRIVDKFDDEKLSFLIAKPIDWESIDKKIQEIKALGVEFLKSSLERI